MKQWATAAEKDNISVQIQMAAVEIATREVGRQRAGHYPTIDLVANKGTSVALATVGGQLETDFQNVGVQLNRHWNPTAWASKSACASTSMC